VDADTASLLNPDEMHERAMVRSLIEFGIKDWDAEMKTADYVFREIDENQLEELIDNKDLLRIVKTYKAWYDAGIEPTGKNFLYHEDRELSELVLQVLDYQTEISPNWGDHFEGHIPSRDELYQEEVFSTLNYLKLRKIKRLIEENQRDLEKSAEAEAQLVLLQTHHHLKNMEIELTKKLGTVIFR